MIEAALTVSLTMLTMTFLAAMWGMKKSLEMEDEKLVVFFATFLVAITVTSLLGWLAASYATGT